MTTRHTHLSRLGAVALASSAALATAAGVAGGASSGSPETSGSGNSGGSATPTTLSGIKTKANTEISQRVTSLDAAIAKVKSARGLGTGQGTLEAYLGTDISPLQQLDQKIQGDQSVAQAAADFRTIFTDFRVYKLVLPASRLAGDAFRTTTTAIPALQSDSAKAQQHVNPANEGVLEPLIDDLNGQVAAATSATNGLAATVLAYTPQQWNANNDLLTPATQSDKQAGSAVAKGRSDVKEIRQIIVHHVKGSPNQPPSTNPGTSDRTDSTPTSS